MYSNPRSVFQEKVGSILEKNKSCSALFENIFKLQYLYKLERITSENKELTDDWHTLLKVYETLGPEMYAKLISIIRGKTLSFPSEEDLQDSIITTLCYYYREVEGRSWDEVKTELNLPDLNTISYGIKTRQFSQFIRTQTLNVLKKVQENGRDESSNRSSKDT
jgi:hypothetical protein